MDKVQDLVEWNGEKVTVIMYDSRIFTTRVRVLKIGLGSSSYKLVKRVCGHSVD